MKKDPDVSNDRTIWAENRQLVLKLMLEFDRDLPTERESEARLYSNAEAEGLLKCHHCLSADTEKITYRVISCRDCRKKSWITAGTFFHRVRAVRPYLAAFYLLGNGAVISASWFAKLVDIAVSSAACILKKLGMVIHSKMMDEAPEASSASFIKVICRRSRDSLAGMHPRAELDAMSLAGENRGGLINPDSPVSSCPSLEDACLPLSEHDKRVFNLLSDESIHFDILCDSSALSVADLAASLSILELAGLVVALPGSRFRRVVVANGRPSAQQQQQTHVVEMDGMLDLAQAIIQQIHGGCSRKCLQIYAALFWCHLDRIRWGIEALFKECFSRGPIEYADIVAFVSPPFIKMLPAPELF